MEFIGRVLREAGADVGDVVKQNVYYVVDDESPPAAEIVRRIDAVQAEYLSAPGPVTTETPVSGLAYEGLLAGDRRLRRGGRGQAPAYVPEGHWSRGNGIACVQGWQAGDWVFVGGQRSLNGDGSLLDAGDIAAQTRNCFNGMAGRPRRGRRLDDRPPAPQHLLPARDRGRRRDRVLGSADPSAHGAYLPDPGPSGTGLRVKDFFARGRADPARRHCAPWAGASAHHAGGPLGLEHAGAVLPGLAGRQRRLRRRPDLSRPEGADGRPRRHRHADRERVREPDRGAQGRRRRDERRGQAQHLLPVRRERRCLAHRVLGEDDRGAAPLLPAARAGGDGGPGGRLRLRRIC